jgi:hypothetical protein
MRLRGDVMADSVDLVRAWQEALQQLGRVATGKLDESTLDQVIAPLQRQAVVLEQALRRQGEFERLGRRLLVPMEGFVEVLEQAPAAMRAQARAFEAAAVSFKKAAEVLDAQAAVLERAVGTMRLPADLLKSVGGLADSEASANKPGAKKPARRR